MTFLELYNELSINFENDFYGDCLTIKSGNQVKFFDISKNFKLLEKIDNLEDEEDKKLIYFLNKYQEVYVIPLETPDKAIYGFVLKSVNTKNFYNYRIKKNFPLVFGLADFENYEFNKLILLCEGIKDVQTLKLVYPYSLAYLTAQPSRDLWNYLCKITNKIVFIPDNDDAGKDLLEYKKFKIFDKYYCQSGKKDFGEYWENSDYLKRQKFIDEIKTILKLKGVECQN